MKSFNQWLCLFENRESDLVLNLINQNNLIQKYGQENLGVRALETIYHHLPNLADNLVKDKEYFNDLIDYFVNDKSGIDMKRNVERFRYHDMTFNDDVKRIFGNDFVNNITTILPIKDQEIKEKFLMDLLQGILLTHANLKNSA
jgi:hypothetical protein